MVWGRGMPVPTLKKQEDGSLEVVKPREDVAPVFIWESSRCLECRR